MIARPNLTLAKLLTESYIDSADSISDLVLFTSDAFDKLDDVKRALFPHMSDDELVATREMMVHHLYEALRVRLEL